MSAEYLLAFNVLQVILMTILGLAIFYIFVFAFAGLFYRQKPYPIATTKRKFAVLIPGYKEDEVIIEVAQEALLQEYPKASFDVIIIADSFQPGTLAKLKALPIKVIEVTFEKSTKSKALNKAIGRAHV